MVNRITRVWRAVVGTQITELETNHADAMLDLEREQLHRQVAQYNRGLAGHAGMCARLEAMIKRLEKEHADISVRVTTQLELGNRDKAGSYALRLETIENQVVEHRAQLLEAEATYRELVRSRDVAIEGAREKISGLKRAIGDYKVNHALAELTEMASSMHGQIGLGDGTMERIQERLEEKRDFAVGRVRVARESIDMTVVEAQEAEQQALAQHALARFEARVEGGEPGA